MHIPRAYDVARPKTQQVDASKQARIGDISKAIELWCQTRSPVESPIGAAQAVAKLDPLMLSQFEGSDPRYGLSFVQANGRNYILAEPNTLVRYKESMAGDHGLDDPQAIVARVPANGLLPIEGAPGAIYVGAVQREDGELGRGLWSDINKG